MELDGGDADVGRLTAAQKECLRLVMAGFKTKEIAYRLGIGVDAVNKRLAGAKATLGSPSRFHAARRLASHEAASTYHSTVGSFSAVAGEASIVDASEDDETAERNDASRPDPRTNKYEAPSAEASSASGLANSGTRSGAVWIFIGQRYAWAFAIASVFGALLRVLVRN